MYYTVIKHDREMEKTRAAGECFQHFSSILNYQCNTRLRLLHLLYDIDFTRAKQ